MIRLIKMRCFPDFHSQFANREYNDSKLYELLAPVDAIRIGRAREREIATNELKKHFSTCQDLRYCKMQYSYNIPF